MLSMAEHLNQFYSTDEEKASGYGREYLATILEIEKATKEYTVYKLKSKLNSLLGQKSRVDDFDERCLGKDVNYANQDRRTTNRQARILQKEEQR